MDAIRLNTANRFYYYFYFGSAKVKAICDAQKRMRA